MTVIQNEMLIQRPVDRVFEFATTPGRWPLWHPSSLGVEGAVDHSLEVGERCTESFRVAGRGEQVVWTVVEREAPITWAIDGRIVGRRNGGVIRYRLTPRDEFTHFEQTFTYETPGLLFRLLNRLLFRRRESAEAVSRLKAVLERE